METIKSEWDVIRLLEEELENRKEAECFKHRLDRLKNLAYTIEWMINTRVFDWKYIHKGTNILCKYLGKLWWDVFNLK